MQRLLLSSICIIILSRISSAASLTKGTLPFTCGDGSLFGAPYNCNIPPAYPEDRRKNENSVRIMQFNADSLFLEGCASWKKFDPRKAAAKTPVGAMEHLQTIANVIYKLNADIIIIDEVCDCCVLRELIRHMPRNHLAQTYQEYMLKTNTENGEHIGIITRVDPIDIWNVDSAPKQIKSKNLDKKRKKNKELLKYERRENELPPPPLPMDQQRRRNLMAGARGVHKKNGPKPKEQIHNPGPKPPKKDAKPKKKSEPDAKGSKGTEKNDLKSPPKPLDKKGNEIKEKKKTVKGLKPPPEPVKTKPKMIREKEYKHKPKGKMQHIAASFNLHLDKPVAIIGAQFADFSENNQRLRRNQAIDLARFANLYSEDYHIIIAGDFQSVPEGEVLKRFAEDTGFKNIGYKYFDRDDFTYLSQLSKGMLDNIFTSQSLYQKIQDTKIDYSHPRPLFPYSNHLPLVIDLDTTWFGGWGSPKLRPPPFKSIMTNENGEQIKTPVNRRGKEERGMMKQNNDEYNSNYGYYYHGYGGQADGDHTNYKKDKPQLVGSDVVNVPPQDQMHEPPLPVASVKANREYYNEYDGYENEGYDMNEYDGYENKVYDGYENEGYDMDEYDGYEEEEEDVIDRQRYRMERRIGYKNEEEDSDRQWLESVLKYLIYGLVGSVCLIIGIFFGWFFVGFWKQYKGNVVHVIRY